MIVAISKQPVDEAWCNMNRSDRTICLFAVDTPRRVEISVGALDLDEVESQRYIINLVKIFRCTQTHWSIWARGWLNVHLLYFCASDLTWQSLKGAKWVWAFSDWGRKCDVVHMIFYWVAPKPGALSWPKFRFWMLHEHRFPHLAPGWIKNNKFRNKSGRTDCSTQQWKAYQWDIDHPAAGRPSLRAEICNFEWYMYWFME
jgi:hypothetical protein